MTNAATPSPSAPSDEEVGQAVLDAARYGDVEDLQELTSTYGGNHLGFRGGNGGNTALHFACANGHVDCVAWLIDQGVEGCAANESGNSPLHWAVQNQHEAVVRLLLEKLENVDVLARNAFGKSVLTEGFAGKSQGILKLLLEHPSADEDALMGGEGQGQCQEGNDGGEVLKAGLQSAKEANEASGGGGEATVIHRLVLDRENDPDRVLQIRELAIEHADDPFGKAAADDTTGLGVWPAALVLAQWLVQERKELLDASTIVELGCGCAVPGLAAALHGRPRAVHLTDLNSETLMNARANLAMNRENFLVPETAACVHVSAMDWGDEQSYPPSAMGAVDLVLGSDLVYQKSLAPLLAQVLCRLMRPGGRFLYVAPATGRDGLEDFVKGLSDRAGLFQVSEKEAGPKLLGNPLEGGGMVEGSTGSPQEEEAADSADQMFFLHFNELATQEVVYKLYEYVKQ